MTSKNYPYTTHRRPDSGVPSNPTGRPGIIGPSARSLGAKGAFRSAVGEARRRGAPGRCAVFTVGLGGDAS